jgi:hypothetical protein
MILEKTSGSKGKMTAKTIKQILKSVFNPVIMVI